MPPDSSSETRFERLKARLADIWSAIREDDAYAHTSVIVPSLSVDQEELAKVQGASFYEERLLFALIRLRNPNARLIYVTSQPVHPDVIDYYLQLLPGVSASHARRAHLTCYNATALELDVPPNGVDPALLELGTKSGSRRVFAETGGGEEKTSAQLAPLFDNRAGME